MLSLQVDIMMMNRLGYWADSSISHAAGLSPPLPAKPMQCDTLSCSAVLFVGSPVLFGKLTEPWDMHLHQRSRAKERGAGLMAAGQPDF